MIAIGRATPPTALAVGRCALAAGVALAAISLRGAEVAPLSRLAVPVEGVRIAALRGTSVGAADDATVAKLFTSATGGLTIYQFDPDARYAYRYARLDRNTDGVVEGSRVHRGDLIGYVGTSGESSAAARHLHFAVVRLGAEKRWWQGEAVDPFLAFE